MLYVTSKITNLLIVSKVAGTAPETEHTIFPSYIPS